MRTFTLASAFAGAITLSGSAVAQEPTAPAAEPAPAHEGEKAAPPAEGEKAAPAEAAPAHEGEGEHAAPAHAEPAAAHGEHGAAHGPHQLEAGAAPEGTEHHEEEGITNWWSWDKSLPPPFGWALVNFAIFLFILSRILWRPIKAGIVERHEKIKHELGEATRLRQAAEAQLAEYTKKVAGAEQEVNALLAQLRKDAEADRARILAAAEAEAVRLKEEADRQIKVEIERARIELRRETVEAALKAAEGMLKSSVNDADQKRLAEKYLTDVEKVAPRTPEQRS